MPLAGAAAVLGAPVERPAVDPENACDYATLSGEIAGLSPMVWGDTLVRFDVDTPGIRTVEGVGVGSAEKDVMSRYAQQRLRTEPHPYDGPEWHYLTVDFPGDSVHRIIFETDGDTVRSFRVGLRSAVDLIEGCA
ncbi:MAG TPA: hypothetical protein VF710_22460 [Longimicrobium sp.]|jgi:hypothetical protein